VLIAENCAKTAASTGWEAAFKFVKEMIKGLGKSAHSGAEERIVRNLPRKPLHANPAITDGVWNANKAESLIAHLVIKNEPVKLIDIHGNPLMSKAFPQYEINVTELLKNISSQKNIHGKITITASELQELLIENTKKALNNKKSGPFSKFKYSFDLASGDVKLTLPRKEGELTAESELTAGFNAYSMATRFAKYLMAAGPGWAAYAYKQGK